MAVVWIPAALQIYSHGQRIMNRFARSAGQDLQAGFEPATLPLSRNTLPFMLSADITPDVSGALWLSP